MKSFKVHDPNMRHPRTISGENLIDAINNNLSSLAYSGSYYDHLLKNISLESVEYNLGILGTKGGVVATLNAYDCVKEASVVLHAWIYAEENDLRTSEA